MRDLKASSKLPTLLVVRMSIPNVDCGLSRPSLSQQPQNKGLLTTVIF